MESFPSCHRLILLLIICSTLVTGELELSSPSNGSVIEICETTEIKEVIANLSASFDAWTTGFVFNLTDTMNKFTTENDTIIVVSDLDVDVETPGTSYVLVIELSHPNSPQTVSTTITISVEDDNDNAPEFGSHNYTFNISEKSTASPVIGTISATDKDSTSQNNMIANYTVIGAAEFKISSEGELSVSSGTTFDYTTTPNYTFIVMATDGGLDDMEMSTNVSVTVNIETEPEFQTPTQVKIMEDIDSGVNVSRLMATDEDKSGDLVFALVKEDYRFVVEDGVLKTSTSVNSSSFDVDLADVLDSVDLSFNVTDGKYSDELTFSVKIQDLNDNLPEFSEPSYNITVYEKASTDDTVLTLSITDKDRTSAFNNISTSIPDTADVPFKMVNFDVVVKSGESLNYTEKTNYTFNVVATSGSGTSRNSATAAISVTVESGPEFQAPALVEIMENIGPGKNVYTLMATDKDRSGDLVFALVTEDHRFVVEDGVLKTSTSVNSSTFDADPPVGTDSLKLSFNVTDGKYSDELTFDVEIQDVNDNSPEFSEPSYNITVYEKASTGDTVLTLSITDKDRTSAFNNIFNDIPDTDVPFKMVNFDVEVKSGESLNYTEKTNYTFDVVATSGSGTSRNSATATVSVAIESGPRFSKLYVNTTVDISENVTVGTSVFMVEARDPDNLPSPNLNYTVVEHSSDVFTFDGNTLTIGETLDADTVQSHTVVFSVSDGKYTTNSSTLTINVVDVNDNSPEFQNDTYSKLINENHLIDTEILTVMAADNDATAPFNTIGYSITAGDDQEVFAISALTGEITLHDKPLLSTYTLIVTATDGGQPPNSANVTVTVTVSDDVVDECVSSPCGENAQACNPLLNDFKCVCKHGWTGQLCQTNIDECDGKVCGNGGDCVDGIAMHTCNCSHGWQGENCTDACGGNKYGRNCEHTCSCNSSRLLDPEAIQTCSISTGHCHCVSNWMGMDCSVDVDECTSSASLCDSTKQEVCENSIGNYSCVCERGYSRTVDTAVCTKDTPSTLETNSNQYVVNISVEISPTASQGCTVNQLKIPSIYEEVAMKAKQMLSRGAPTGKQINIRDIRCGSYIIDAQIAINNNNAEKASLSVELQKLGEGRDVTFGDETLQLDEITIDERNLTQTSTSGTYNERLCAVFTTVSPCPSGQICSVENESPRCRQPAADSRPRFGSAATTFVCCHRSCRCGVLKKQERGQQTFRSKTR
ncbi:protocadherin Fat 4-like isoform X2 [Mya arenaria]|uniref:protocadherin Fat 4-like isoform X2 n=1 Tax=Mya arenaria TaxID=6604 RepID=UPI0022E91451|nr:protocadherin Fat 4-like isoform X2 [Mya arenaria]